MKGRGWGIEPEKVPWSLWAYVALMGVSLVVLLTRSIHVEPAIFAVVFLGAWAYFLLRGVRWLWIATAVFLAVFLVVDLATASGTWFGDSTGLVQLVLLILPATRQFFAPERTRATA
jgi:cell division protein FtsW (lipid II flippase)